MKYKELRISAVLLFILAGAVIEAIIGITDHDTGVIIVAAIIAFSALTFLIGKYNFKVGEDYILIYEFKGIGILPTMIDFKDIERIEVKNSFKAAVYHHQKKSNIYILAPAQFAKEVEEASESFEKTKKAE